MRRTHSCGRPQRVQALPFQRLFDQQRNRCIVVGWKVVLLLLLLLLVGWCSSWMPACPGAAASTRLQRGSDLELQDLVQACEAKLVIEVEQYGAALHRRKVMKERNGINMVVAIIIKHVG